MLTEPESRTSQTRPTLQHTAAAVPLADVRHAGYRSVKATVPGLWVNRGVSALRRGDQALTTPRPKASMTEENDLEAQRLANIAANAQRMQEFGLHEAALSVKPKAKAVQPPRPRCMQQLSYACRDLMAS